MNYVSCTLLGGGWGIAVSALFGIEGSSEIILASVLFVLGFVIAVCWRFER